MISLHIPNMSCGGCARGVAAAIHEVDARARIEPDLAARRIVVQSTAAEAQLRKALAEAGFAPA